MSDLRHCVLIKEFCNLMYSSTCACLEDCHPTPWAPYSKFGKVNICLNSAFNSFHKFYHGRRRCGFDWPREWTLLKAHYVKCKSGRLEFNLISTCKFVTSISQWALLLLLKYDPSGFKSSSYSIFCVYISKRSLMGV